MKIEDLVVSLELSKVLKSPDFTQGKEWTMRQIIKIINNIK